MSGGYVDSLTIEAAIADMPHAELVFEMLALIGIKRLGRVPFSFIAYIGPEIVRLNAEAVREVLQEALADGEDRSMTYATFYQPALRYCEAHGLKLEGQHFNLVGWQPEQGVLLQ